MFPHGRIRAACRLQTRRARASLGRSDGGGPSPSPAGPLGREGIVTSDAESAMAGVSLGSVHAGTRRFSPHEVTSAGVRNGRSARPSATASLLSRPGFAETRLPGRFQGPVVLTPCCSLAATGREDGQLGSRAACKALPGGTAFTQGARAPRRARPLLLFSVCSPPPSGRAELGRAFG